MNMLQVEIVWIEWSIIFETLFANFEVLVWRLKYLAIQDSPNMVWENIYKFVNVGISTRYHENTCLKWLFTETLSPGCCIAKTFQEKTLTMALILIALIKIVEYSPFNANNTKDTVRRLSMQKNSHL